MKENKRREEKIRDDGTGLGKLPHPRGQGEDEPKLGAAHLGKRNSGEEKLPKSFQDQAGVLAGCT